MEEKSINYYEEGTKIGNYAIFNNKIVVDKNNRVLLTDESGDKDLHGFRDIIYYQSEGSLKIYSAEDFSFITAIEGQLICLDELHDKYLIDYMGLPDEHDLHVLDAEFNEWTNPSFKGNITDYDVYSLQDEKVKIVLEFDHQYKEIYDEDLASLNTTTYPVVKYLYKNMALLGTSDSFYCLYDIANKTCLQKDGKEYHFQAYVLYDWDRYLLAVKEADKPFYLINYTTLEPFCDTPFDDIQPYGEGLFGASIHGIRGVYDEQLQLQFELSYERCLFPFKYGLACFRIHEGENQKNVVIDDKGHILFSYPSNYEVEDILEGRIFAMKYLEDNGLYKIAKYKIWDASGNDLAGSRVCDDLFGYCQASDGSIGLIFQQEYCEDPPYCRVISNRGEIIKDNLTCDEMWECIL